MRPALLFAVFFVFSLGASMSFGLEAKKASAPTLKINSVALIKSAREAFQKSDLDEALKILEKVRENDPENFEAFSLYARVQLGIGTTFQDQGKNEEATVWIDRAIQTSDELVQKFPNQAEAQFSFAATRGFMALLKGGKDKVKLGWAIKVHAEKAIELDPKFFAPYVVLGVFYDQLGSLSFFEKFFANLLYGSIPAGGNAEAEQYLLKARDLNPEFAFTYYMLGLIYGKMGKKSLQIQNLERCLKTANSDPRDPYIKSLVRKSLDELKGKKTADTSDEDTEEDSD